MRNYIFVPVYTTIIDGLKTIIKKYANAAKTKRWHIVY